MKISKRFIRNAVLSAAVGAMVTAMMPVAAFAAFAPDTKALDGSGYVTGASPRPPASSLDMLGISDVECDPLGISAGLGEQTWASPKYYIWGSTYYNTNANPWITNAVINHNAGSVVATPTAVAGGNAAVRTLNKSAGGNPDAGLPVYGTTDEVNALWDLKPDVVFGTAADTVSYTSEEYKTAFEAGGITNYNPKSVRYDWNDISSIIKSVYNLADAADTVVKESNGTKKLRYNSTATAIAQNYEEYVHGLQGFILQQLEVNKAKKKTAAIITAYDEATGTYKLMNDNSGSATAKRYLEVVKNVSKNLGDTLETATAADLAKADVVIIQQDIKDKKPILESFDSKLSKKVYYATSTNLGAAYSVARNSTDNAQDMGRVLGCLYPEYITQDELVCYYFDKFYHIRSGVLGEFVDNAMDGVVNWDATGTDRTQWTAADAKEYNAKTVQAKLDLGTAWLAKNAKNASKVNKDIALETKADGSTYATIKGSDYSKLAKAVLTKQTVKVTPATKTVSSKKTASFKIKATAAGKVSFSVSKSAKAAGITVSKAGKVTVKKGAKKGTYKVSVKAAATSLYKAATKTVTVKVK